MGKYKDKKGTSFMGDLLRKGKEIGVEFTPEVLKVAGTLTGIGGLKELGKALDKDPNVTSEMKGSIMGMASIHLENTKNAREMQISALGQEDILSKRFVYYFAIFWSVIGALYLFLATFTEIVNPKMADTVLGFLLGTIVGTIINFFYGSHQDA